MIPVPPLHLADGRVGPIPFCGKLLEPLIGLFHRASAVDRPQIRRHVLTLFPRHVVQPSPALGGRCKAPPASAEIPSQSLPKTPSNRPRRRYKYPPRPGFATPSRPATRTSPLRRWFPSDPPIAPNLFIPFHVHTNHDVDRLIAYMAHLPNLHHNRVCLATIRNDRVLPHGDRLPDCSCRGLRYLIWIVKVYPELQRDLPLMLVLPKRRIELSRDGTGASAILLARNAANPGGLGAEPPSQSDRFLFGFRRSGERTND